MNELYFQYTMVKSPSGGIEEKKRDVETLKTALEKAEQEGKEALQSFVSQKEEQTYQKIEQYVSSPELCEGAEEAPMLNTLIAVLLTDQAIYPKIQEHINNNATVNGKHIFELQREGTTLVSLIRSIIETEVPQGSSPYPSAVYRIMKKLQKNTALLANIQNDFLEIKKYLKEEDNRLRNAEKKRSSLRGKTEAMVTDAKGTISSWWNTMPPQTQKNRKIGAAAVTVGGIYRRRKSRQQKNEKTENNDTPEEEKSRREKLSSGQQGLAIGAAVAGLGSAGDYAYEELKELKKETKNTIVSNVENLLGENHDFKYPGFGENIRAIEYDHHTQRVHISKFLGEPAEHSGTQFLCGRTTRRNAFRSGILLPRCHSCEILDNIGNDGSTKPLSVQKDRGSLQVPSEANVAVIHMSGKTSFDHTGIARKIQEGPRAGQRVIHGAPYYGGQSKMQDPKPFNFSKNKIGNRTLFGAAFYKTDQVLYS